MVDSKSPDARLTGFVSALARLVQTETRERDILAAGVPLLAELVAHDDWLPPAYATPHPDHYQQYLLHRDDATRFSVVSFVWGPGQATPIHDHRVWGMIGMLRGAETGTRWGRDAAGRFGPREAVRLNPGMVECVSPRLGDIHRVANAYDDRVSISIHVYGADIGAVERRIYAEDGSSRPFVSRYADPLPPLEESAT